MKPSSRSPQGPRKRRYIPRDTILFFSGLAGVVHQTIFTPEDRATLLLLFGAMMGLPAFLRVDESRRPGGNDDEGDGQ